jgi:inosine-uridine nucleoside N-ribohydrolase
MPCSFVLDMETSDPDDFLTLLLLLGHPRVELRAVTITPGTREQVGLVRWALAELGRQDVAVGAHNPEHPKKCVSAWHYSAYGIEPREADPDDLGPAILARHLGPDTTLVTGAALKNLGRLLQLPDRPSQLGRLYVQGGFAGEGVVPTERQLPKFRGLRTCPSFNLGGDPKAVFRVLEHRASFSDLHFVSKNVCHDVIYDSTLHERAQQALSSMTPGSLQHQTWSWVVRGMGHYLDKTPSGKALHDPLAACCAIEPELAQWAEVEIFREKGEWGSRLAPGSGVHIITGYDHERFVQVLLGA